MKCICSFVVRPMTCFSVFTQSVRLFVYLFGWGVEVHTSFTICLDVCDFSTSCMHGGEAFQLTLKVLDSWMCSTRILMASRPRAAPSAKVCCDSIMHHSKDEASVTLRCNQTPINKKHRGDIAIAKPRLTCSRHQFPEPCCWNFNTLPASHQFAGHSLAVITADSRCV